LQTLLAEVAGDVQVAVTRITEGTVSLVPDKNFILTFYFQATRNNGVLSLAKKTRKHPRTPLLKTQSLSLPRGPEAKAASGGAGEEGSAVVGVDEAEVARVVLGPEEAEEDVVVVLSTVMSSVPLSRLLLQVIPGLISPPSPPRLLR
jgi:hypothetical protein